MQHDVCDRKGCANRATVGPVLECFAPIIRRHSPIEVAIGVRVCPVHAEPDLSLYLTDSLWEVICKIARAERKLVPKRSRTRVKFLSLAEHAKRFPPPARPEGQ